MRDRKRYVKPLILAAAAMLAVTGCSGKEKETETQTNTSTETPETPTVLEKVTYTSADGNISIILPDSKWVALKDEDGKIIFHSEEEGAIVITYADSKKEVNELAIGSTEEKLKKKLKKLGENVDNLEISNFKFDNSTGIKRCSYSLKYKDISEGSYYTVTSVSTAGGRGYQMSGTITKDDTVLLGTVEESLNSALILKNPLSADSKKEKKESEEETSGSSSEEERFFFDEQGNTIYVTQNAEGAWADKDGMSYRFYEKHVEDRDGTKYYYDPPSYRSGGAEVSSDSEETADYYDFYDSNGNYVKARQDENGNWVGDDGKTYIFGDKGVTDSEGNFHPY